MNTGTGLSGSTDWNNGVRSRLYFQTPKTSDGETLNKDLRTLESKKSNYGEHGGTIDLEWKNGLFGPVQTPGGFHKLAAERKADDTFLNLLAEFKRQERDVSHNVGPTYAPAIFAGHPDAAGMSKAELLAAMNRLLKAAKVQIETTGRPSKRRSRLILTEGTVDAQYAQRSA